MSFDRFGGVGYDEEFTYEDFDDEWFDDWGDMYDYDYWEMVGDMYDAINDWVEAGGS